MIGAHCCVGNNVAWCLGSARKPNSRQMYSWAGPGTSWISQRDLPIGSQMKYPSMVYDKVHKSIWAFAGGFGVVVYMYSLKTSEWKKKPDLPYVVSNTRSVLCGGKYIITPGGDKASFGATTTILLTDINNGYTIAANTTLPSHAYYQAVACVTSTPT